MKTLILGGGLAGLSCSYHLGHENCLIIERNAHLGGHASTYQRDGAFWDEGPHVSFTKHNDVRELLAWSAGGDVLEYPSNVGNYFAGYWIPHPAQSHLYAVPEPLAGQCYKEFVANQEVAHLQHEPKNYQQWLDQAFGSTFSRTFPHAYTRKYWTCDPSELATDWIGGRVFKPDLETVAAGYEGRPKENTHYINSVRYPAHGGFGTFSSGFSRDARVLHDEVTSINLSTKVVQLASGQTCAYETLVNTIPLDKFVFLLADVPPEVKTAASLLRCTSLLLVNILGSQDSLSPYHWLYDYDEDKYSTRITQTHLLARSNVPKDLAGIQVEVYASPYRPFRESHSTVAAKVADEVHAMGLIKDIQSMHYHFVPYANIIFDHQRRKSQDIVLSYLSGFGMVREADDLEPITDWKSPHKFTAKQELSLAGRFAQWKYFWSDDCILRGRQIAGIFNGSSTNHE